MTERKSDMPFVGRVLKRWIEAHWDTTTNFERATRTAHTTLYDVFRAVPSPKDPANPKYPADHKVVRRLETALGFPPGTVERLSRSDFTGMEGNPRVPVDLVDLARGVAAEQAREAGERRARERNVG